VVSKASERADNATARSDAQSEGARPKGETSPDLGQVFHSTLRTIERRSSWYRTLVVAVVLVCSSSIGAALVMWSWLPILGLWLCIPMTGVFLFVDAREVRRWHDHALAGWLAGSVGLLELKQGLEMYPRIPSLTLAGMLSTLPEPGFEEIDGRGAAEDKPRVAAESTRLLVRKEWRCALGVFALALAVASGAVALVLGSGMALAGLGIAALLRGVAGRL
jgi:hypothetical protein